MKKSKIIAVFRFLSGIKVSKIKDKDVRSAIISNHLQMYKIVEEYESDIKEIQKKLFEGKDEDIKALSDLREKYKNEKDEEKKKDIIGIITDNYGEILNLEKEMTEALESRLNEEKELNLKKVNRDDFIDAIVEAGEDVTTSDLVELTDLLSEE
ncbi:MAG: hypothetical protein ACI4TK_06775 [Agathobacter sp.]